MNVSRRTKCKLAQYIKRIKNLRGVSHLDSTISMDGNTIHLTKCFPTTNKLMESFVGRFDDFFLSTTLSFSPISLSHSLFFLSLLLSVCLSLSNQLYTQPFLIVQDPNVTSSEKNIIRRFIAIHNFKHIPSYNNVSWMQYEWNWNLLRKLGCSPKQSSSRVSFIEKWMFKEEKIRNRNVSVFLVWWSIKGRNLASLANKTKYTASKWANNRTIDKSNVRFQVQTTIASHYRWIESNIQSRQSSLHHLWWLRWPRGNSHSYIRIVSPIYIVSHIRYMVYRMCQWIWLNVKTKLTFSILIDTFILSHFPN